MTKKKVILLIAAAALAAVSACTNREGESESPVTLSVDLEEQPGFIDVCSAPAPIQVTSMSIQSTLKNSSASDPQGFATVQLGTYEVRFRRLDGGTRVPPVQTFSTGVTVTAGGTATLDNFPIMVASAVTGTPMDQLLPFNGGIDRETNKTDIVMAFDITFFGRTVSGHRVQSQTASGILIFRCES